MACWCTRVPSRGMTRVYCYPVRTGAGKTTLVTYLVDHQFRYLTDELALIPTGRLEIDGFRRPLKIKNAAYETLRTQCRKLGLWWSQRLA